MSAPEQISFVIPLYNEEKTIPLLHERLTSLLDSLNDVSIEVLLINDGSSDGTEELITRLALTDSRYHALSLSRNYGHQTALTAGLKHARGTEGVMVLDGDLQDPPEQFPIFYDKFREGYDVVYGVRRKRKEGFMKRMAYFLFYRLQKQVSNIDIPLDSGDFSFISRRVVDIMNQMPEESRYLRGMRSWIGFRQTGVEYERHERAAGESKYPFRAMMKLAYNGLFNFSEFPIKFIKRTGMISILVSMVYAISVLIKKYFLGGVPEGFTALFFAILLFSGVQLLCLGVIGEYVVRIFFQSKNRPLFIIKSEIVQKEYQADPHLSHLHP
jgi:glycosyltransferase involved in cell wall biosynthesis